MQERSSRNSRKKMNERESCRTSVRVVVNIFVTLRLCLLVAIFRPTATARARLFRAPMPPVMSFPHRPLHLRPHRALTGCVRPRAAMTTPDAMGFGACYPERSDSRHAPVIIVQSGDNHPWSYHMHMRRALGPSRPCPESSHPHCAQAALEQFRGAPPLLYYLVASGEDHLETLHLHHGRVSIVLHQGVL